MITYGELAAGFTDRKALDERLRGIPVLSIEPAAAWIAGHIFRTLKQAGNTIGANDIWIAAIAINARLPLLTRNQGQFSRINNLTVISY